VAVILGHVAACRALPFSPRVLDFLERLNDNFCPTDDGTDYLPGNGPNSSNADAGHQYLTTTGMHSLQRNAQNLGRN
jgi:hypothetical protein